MATSIGSVRADMSANWGAFKNDMGKAKQAVQENATAMERAMAKVGGGFTKATGSLKTFVSALAIGAAFRAIIKATTEQEAAVAQLEQTLKSTGRYTPELSAKLQEYAGHLQKTTTYADETVNAMQALLLTFTNIGGDEFNRAQMAVLDVATAMKTDLKTAAIQVGKALNDPVLGMTALSRSGIQFSDAQKEVVKQLVATGDMVGAQKVILKELEVQFGGSANAARNTLGGALEGLKNAFGDLLEGDTKGGGVKGTTAALNELTKLLSDKQTVENAQVLINAMITGFSKVAEKISTVVEFTKWFSEQGAALIYGVNSDDIIRLSENLDVAKKKLADLEKDYPAGALPDKLLGKIGISGEMLDKVRGITSAREEVAKLQKQVDDYYAAEEKRRATPQVVAPNVPAVKGAQKGISEDGSAERKKREADEQKAQELRREIYLKDEADKWEKLEEYEKDYADKQAKFQDDYKRATMSTTAYELEQLSLRYDEYATYISDKEKLDEWYEAEKARLLDKEADKEKDQFDDLKRVIEGWGRDSTDAIVKFCRTGEMSFSNMIDSMIDDLLRMVIQEQIMSPLFKGISQGIGGLAGGFISGLFGGGSAPVGGGGNVPPEVFVTKHGGAFLNGEVLPFARGGIVSQPTVFPMARGTGLMGEAGAEAVMPLARVGGDLGVRALAGGGTEVNIYNNVGADVSTKERTTADGSKAIDVYIDQAVAKKLGQFGSQSNRAMRQMGGRQPLTGR